ncbi:MAG: ATP phosphoribosyltransferase [Planctomycetota bacterium]|nr:ATP phosphoribosyltransferase [Planctomycetota bacterium]
MSAAQPTPNQGPQNRADPRQSSEVKLRLGVPKGRMHDQVVALLGDAGIKLSASARGYRPTISLRGVEAKILKPQTIIEMLAQGTRDAGFAGADWVAEFRADVVRLLDLGLDAVRLVAAAPAGLLEGGKLPSRRLRVASEMERLTRSWISSRGRDDVFVRSYGATEVLPPEDADCIVDIAASGATLEANGLVVVDELMRSTTGFYASRAAMDDPGKRGAIEDLALLLGSVIEARRRVMIEVNVSKEKLDAVAKIMPCMREPTIAMLHHDAGYVIKVAALRELLPRLIPQIKLAGGTDIVVSPISQVVP